MFARSMFSSSCALMIAGVTVLPAAASQDTHNTANAVSLEAGHPDSFAHFAAELPSMLERMPALDPEHGLHVAEVEPGLFFVTEGVYQAAFLATSEGVVVFDAPPSLAAQLRQAIEREAPQQPITHLIYSHGHTDHVGGSKVFADIDGLTVMASSGVAESLRHRRHS